MILPYEVIGVDENAFLSLIESKVDNGEIW